MTMNKKSSSINVATFLSALLVSGICFSAQVDKDDISSRCEKVYNTLYGIYEVQESGSCSDRVLYSSYVMQGASALVRSERYPDAMKNLKIAEGILGKVYSKSQECAYFSSKVKPSLDEVQILFNELERISNGLGSVGVSLN